MVVFSSSCFHDDDKFNFLVESCRQVGIAESRECAWSGLLVILQCIELVIPSILSLESSLEHVRFDRQRSMKPLSI